MKLGGKYFKDVIFEQFRNCVVKKQQLHLVNWQQGELNHMFLAENISQKEIQETLDIVQKWIIRILTPLSFDQKKMFQKHTSFFKWINYQLKGHSFLAKDFYTLFELERYKFSQNGKIQYQSIKKKKMFFLTVLIIRILILQLFKLPETFEYTFTKTKMMEYNIKILASIIYHTAMNYIRKKYPEQRENFKKIKELDSI